MQRADRERIRAGTETRRVRRIQRAGRRKQLMREHSHLDDGGRRQRERVGVVDFVCPLVAARPLPRIACVGRRRNRAEVFEAGVGGVDRRRRYRRGRDLERERARLGAHLGGGGFYSIRSRAQNPLDSRIARRERAQRYIPPRQLDSPAGRRRSHVGRVVVYELRPGGVRAPRQIKARIGVGRIQLYLHRLGRGERERVMLGSRADDSRRIAVARPGLIRRRSLRAVRQRQRRGGARSGERRGKRQREVADPSRKYRRCLYRIVPRRQQPRYHARFSPQRIIVSLRHPVNGRERRRGRVVLPQSYGGSRSRSGARAQNRVRGNMARRFRGVVAFSG